MNPLMIKPLLITGAVALALGFGGGWMVNGWRLNADIADLKTNAATAQAATATAALADLETGMKRVTAAAKTAQGNVGTVNSQLDQIRKEFKNATPPPLPAGCNPDDIRMRALAAAAGAVDEAIARPKPSGAVQAERSTTGPK